MSRNKGSLSHLSPFIPRGSHTGKGEEGLFCFPSGMPTMPMSRGGKISAKISLTVESISFPLQILISFLGFFPFIPPSVIGTLVSLFCRLAPFYLLLFGFSRYHISQFSGDKRGDGGRVGGSIFAIPSNTEGLALGAYIKLVKDPK